MNMSKSKQSKRGQVILEYVVALGSASSHWWLFIDAEQPKEKRMKTKFKRKQGQAMVEYIIIVAPASFS